MGAARHQAVRDHRFKSAYIFGAVCPERDTGIAVVISRADAEATNPMLEEASLAVSPGAHAIMPIDGAGWHVGDNLVVPSNITLLPLPPYSPELDAIEKLWQFMRENILSHRLFADLDAVIDACCSAWNRTIAGPGRIRSTRGFPWAVQVKILWRWHQTITPGNQPPPGPSPKDDDLKIGPQDLGYAPNRAIAFEECGLCPRPPSCECMPTA